jgi:hypothetical protein
MYRLRNVASGCGGNGLTSTRPESEKDSRYFCAAKVESEWHTTTGGQ